MYGQITTEKDRLGRNIVNGTYAESSVVSRPNELILFELQVTKKLSKTVQDLIETLTFYMAILCYISYEDHTFTSQFAVSFCPIVSGADWTL